MTIDHTALVSRGATARIWAAVIVIALLGAMSYIDRQAIAVLVEDIQRDLALTDVQLGWLMGPAFFIMFNVALLPAAYSADRWNRKRLIIAGVVLWSLFTIMSGFATSYWQLVFLRCGVAVGEAVLGPAALSLIANSFMRSERPLPTSFYVVGCTVGASGSAFFAAITMQAAAGLHVILPATEALGTWRLTFVGLGMPGLILATCLALALREPTRVDVSAGAYVDSSSFLRSHGRMFLLSFVSLSMFLMTMPSVALWGPSFLVRAFSVSPIESGYMVGLASLIGGGTGALVLPSIIRHYARNHRTDAFSTLVLGTMVLALVCAIVAGFGGSLWIALAGIGGFMFFAGGAATMPTLIVQLFAPLQLCGRISAVAMFMIYLFGFGLAPVLVPMLASYCAGEPAALGYAIAVLALLSSLIAIPLFAMIRPAFRRAEEAVFAYEVEAEAHA